MEAINKIKAQIPEPYNQFAETLKAMADICKAVQKDADTVRELKRLKR